MMGKGKADFVLLPPVADNGITTTVPLRPSRTRRGRERNQERNPEERQSDGRRRKTPDPFLQFQQKKS